MRFYVFFFKTLTFSVHGFAFYDSDNTEKRFCYLLPSMEILLKFNFQTPCYKFLSSHVLFCLVVTTFQKRDKHKLSIKTPEVHHIF